MVCEWTYKIEAEQNFQNVTVDIAGHSVTLTPKVKKKKLITAEGKVSFECKNIGKCLPKIFNLSYTDPPTVDLGDLGDIWVFSGTASGVAGTLGLTINQPSLAGDSTIKLMLINNGSCLNVHLITTVNVTSGSVSYDPPDIPVPGTSLKYPTPPIQANIGESFTDKLSAEYLLYCCRWDDSLKEFDPETDREPKDIPMEPNYVIPEDDCGIDCEFKNNYVTQTNKKAPISWKITAIEGECKYKHVFVSVVGGGGGAHTGRATKRRKGKKKEKQERTPK
ncbi:MAG: hypothetical protein ABIH76_04305 [Candidatus Bathyarchaeota archaeon]